MRELFGRMTNASALLVYVRVAMMTMMTTQ